MPEIGDALRRAIFQRSLEVRECSHLDTVQEREPRAGPCGDCDRESTTTVHLRMCLACGNVGCCDSSPARHARRHHQETGHPLIRSVEPGERWAWCYPDRAYLSGVDG